MFTGLCNSGFRTFKQKSRGLETLTFAKGGAEKPPSEIEDCDFAGLLGDQLPSFTREQPCFAKLKGDFSI